jgi:IrrE N-terminal-like domain
MAKRESRGDALDLHIAILLRALVPYRRLGYVEALFYAEQQATVFLKLVHLLEPPVPIERLVTEVGLAMAIKNDPMQPVAGQSVLDPTSGEWTITLNMNRGSADRAFVVAREMKRILDHGFGSKLYQPVDVMTTGQRCEHTADYFAMCVLIPQLWVERYWRRGFRNVEEMASVFETTSARMLLRLQALALETETDDCAE